MGEIFKKLLLVVVWRIFAIGSINDTEREIHSKYGSSSDAIYTKYTCLTIIIEVRYMYDSKALIMQILHFLSKVTAVV